MFFSILYHMNCMNCPSIVVVFLMQSDWPMIFSLLWYMYLIQIYSAYTHKTAIIHNICNFIVP